MPPTEEKFDINAKDDDILATFSSWLKESQSYHDAMLEWQKQAEAYYLGEQTERDAIPDNLTSTVENRIFEAVETLVPIATANGHEFIAMPGSENEVSLQKAEILQKWLTRKYETLEIKLKSEDAIRHFLLFRFGVMKPCWDETTDDINVYVVDPRLILIPKLRCDPHELPYVMEVQEYTRSEIEEYFPKVKPDDLKVDVKIDTGSKQSQKGEAKKTYKVFEVWTDEMVGWIQPGKILDKMANPYYDFEGEEQEAPKSRSERVRDIVARKKTKSKKVKKYFNHFGRPEKPYIFFTTFRVADGPVAPVSLVEIGIPIQDAINVQKRQIIDNLRRMGNGQVYVDSDAMSQEEAENITNEIGLIIRGEGVASQNKVRREPGVQLPNSHFANLQHSEAVFDNIMGIHSATRGQAAAKTLGQDILSKQQDYTRIDIITRVLNRGMSRLANWMVQLAKMYYTEAHVEKFLGPDRAVEFIKLVRDDIEDYIEIDVRSGRSVQFDEVTLANQAVQLWQLNALDPVTLYERTGFPNPEKTAERLIAWKTGQLTQETQAELAKIQLQSTLRAAATPKKPGEKTNERGVETPLTALSRARTELTGVAPVAPGTPNQ